MDASGPPPEDAPAPAFLFPRWPFVSESRSDPKEQADMPRQTMANRTARKLLSGIKLELYTEAPPPLERLGCPRRGAKLGGTARGTRSFPGSSARARARPDVGTRARSLAHSAHHGTHLPIQVNRNAFLRRPPPPTALDI